MLVVAKAPVPGEAKTRLAVTVGAGRAADLAAAALLDTLEACSADHPPGHRHLAITGDLRAACRRDEIGEALAGWTVFPQRGNGFADRLANAHLDARERGAAPVVQIGMDTPQVRGRHLAEVARGLDGHDAVLAPAADGGWWALALRDPRHATALRGIPMSEPDTGERTRDALEAAGLSVATSEELTDVDTAEDARKVAAACGGHFAEAWARHEPAAAARP